jgi:hypothetical protein
MPSDLRAFTRLTEVTPATNPDTGALLPGAQVTAQVVLLRPDNSLVFNAQSTVYLDYTEVSTSKIRRRLEDELLREPWLSEYINAGVVTRAELNATDFIWLS